MRVCRELVLAVEPGAAAGRSPVAFTTWLVPSRHMPRRMQAVIKGPPGSSFSVPTPLIQLMLGSCFHCSCLSFILFLMAEMTIFGSRVGGGQESVTGLT